MNLKENPFFILNVSPHSNRRQIGSAVDELGFVLDGDVCANAQSTLLTPNKRIDAELGWLLDSDDETVKQIKQKIEDGGTIVTEDLPVVSQFNALLYNFSNKTNGDVGSISRDIIELSELFDILDIVIAKSAINRARSGSGFPDASETEVLAGLSRKLDEVKEIIRKRLDRLPDEDYTLLTTGLAEHLVRLDNPSEGSLIKEIVSQYEIKEQAELERNLSVIHKRISQIKNLTDYDTVEDDLRDLIRLVKLWDKIAQPMQLVSSASGMPHQMSEDLGNELRQLAVYLHNEKGKTNASLFLIAEIKPIFAELTTLSDAIDSDAKTLDNLISGEEETKKIIAEIEDFEKLSNGLNENTSNTTIETYVRKIRYINIRISDSNLDPESKKKLRTHVCILARATAVSLHNDHELTNGALNITTELLECFSDIYELRVKLQDDKATLSRELTAQQIVWQRQSEELTRKYEAEERWKKIKWVILIVAIVIACISGIDSKTTSSSKSTTTTTAPTTGNFSNDESANPQTTVEQPTAESTTTKKSKKEELGDKADALKLQINMMESNLTKLQRDIDGYVSDLEDMESDLDYNEKQYNSTHSETYRLKYNSLIDDYNDAYERYSDAVEDYNELYEKYDSSITEYNRMVAEYNAMY